MNNVTVLRNNLDFPILALLVCLALFVPDAYSKQPNVVLILTDDQGYSDVGFNGNPIVNTPQLDRFAAEATIFDQFYACPVCSPTRARGVHLFPEYKYLMSRDLSSVWSKAIVVLKQISRRVLTLKQKLQLTLIAYLACTIDGT